MVDGSTSTQGGDLIEKDTRLINETMVCPRGGAGAFTYRDATSASRATLVTRGHRPCRSDTGSCIRAGWGEHVVARVEVFVVEPINQAWSEGGDRVSRAL